MNSVGDYNNELNSFFNFCEAFSLETIFYSYKYEKVIIVVRIRLESKEKKIDKKQANQKSNL